MMRQNNFADLSEQYAGLENAAVVLVPAPYDFTSTWIKGADKGPAAIIDASVNMELYDIETDSEVYKKGIFTAEPLRLNCKPEEMVEKVRQAVASFLQKEKFTVVLGGEHSVSIGAVAAHVDRFAALTVLQLDAHSDLRDSYEGSKYSHACVMARVKQFAPVVQVGIRSMDSGEKECLERDRVFFAKDIYNNTGWIESVLAKLGGQVYITIDLDVFDPSVMPSVGTSEPGGLGWYGVLTLLKAVFRAKNVVGFDLAELCPNPANRAPDFLAAKLIYKMLSYKFADQNTK